MTNLYYSFKTAIDQELCYCLYMAVGLLILPMNKMLLVESSKMKTMKGLFSFIVSGMLIGMISMVVLAAAVVPVSSTLSAARCDTW